MFFAKSNQRLPIGIDKGLMCLREKKPSRLHKDEINYIKSLVKDKNYRILLSKDGINTFNSKIFLTGLDPFEFYDSLEVEDDSSHAFYLENVGKSARRVRGVSRHVRSRDCAT